MGMCILYTILLLVLSILLTILCSVSILSILFELVLMSGYELLLASEDANIVSHPFAIFDVLCRLSFSFVSLYP